MDFKDLLSRLDDLSEAKKVSGTGPKFVGYLGAEDPASKIPGKLVGAMEQVEQESRDRLESLRPEIVAEDPVSEDILDKVKRSFAEYLSAVAQEMPDSNTMDPAEDRELVAQAGDLDLHDLAADQDQSQDYLDER